MKTYNFKYGHGSVSLSLNEADILAELHGTETPPISDIRSALFASLEQPIDSAPLRQRVRPGDRVALVISDMTRFWMRQDLVIPHLVDYLIDECGVQPEHLTIVVANGTHIGGDEQELRTLVTDGVYNRVRVKNHDCEAKDLAYLGTTPHETPVWIDRTAAEADLVVCLGAATHHVMAGFGGAIKNLAMGCAPQAGKIDQHGRNVVIYPKCIGCGQCVPLCPRNALSLEKAEKGRHAVIDKERCIGCYECVTACKQGAIGVDTPNEYSDFAERMAEYAYGAVKGKEGRICYLNFLLNVTPQCDCAGWSEPAIVPDLGILASEDPVALDTACFDLVKEAHSLIPLGEHGAHSCGYDKFSALHPNTRGWHQVEYAESIGMGSRDYELITV